VSLVPRQIDCHTAQQLAIMRRVLAGRLYGCACAEMLRLAMAVKATPNPPGTAELLERLDTLRGVLYSDRPKMGATETVRAAVAELGGTQEALTRLLTLCAALPLTLTRTVPANCYFRSRPDPDAVVDLNPAAMAFPQGINPDA